MRACAWGVRVVELGCVSPGFARIWGGGTMLGWDGMHDKKAAGGMQGRLRGQARAGWAPVADVFTPQQGTEA